LLSVEALGLSADLSSVAVKAAKEEAARAAKAEAVAQKAPAATFSRKPAPSSTTAMDGLVPRQPGMATGPVASAAPVAGKTAGSGAPKDGSAKGDPGLWDAVRRNLEGKKKTVLLGLLSQMRGELREGEFVITCGHEMMLDRLKEKDKWQPLLTALEEAAGRVVPVRLSVSTEKKTPEPDAVAPGDVGLERKALEEPVVLEILRTFEGSMLVKVQPAPPVEVPRNEVAADDDGGEPEFPEPVE